MKSLLAKIKPKYQKYLLITGVLLGLVGVAMVSSGNSQSESKAQTRGDTIRNILTSGNTRRVSLDAMNSKLERANSEINKLTRRVEHQSQQMTTARTRSTSASVMANSIGRLEANVKKLRAETKELKQLVESVEETVENVDLTMPVASVPNDDQLEEEPGGQVKTEDDGEVVTPNMSDAFKTAVYPKPAVPSAQTTSETNGTQNAQAIPSTIAGNIVTISQKVAIAEPDDEENEDDVGLFLASGSILTGVILNGMDAPTNQNARKDPFPSLLRVQKEAILPNNFRADIRECFIIMSGYGDLSSERAYLRGETLSCVREDGGVIEATLASYAVGEDGKAGIRGRLVSKQGAIIGRSLLAGFLSGAANAFSSPQIPAINTSGENQALYQSLMSSGAISNATLSGTSNALDRIAQYYIDRAEGIHPVIEIDAGRQVEIIVTKGAKLSFKGAAT